MQKAVDSEQWTGDSGQKRGSSTGVGQGGIEEFVMRKLRAVNAGERRVGGTIRDILQMGGFFRANYQRSCGSVYFFCVPNCFGCGGFDCGAQTTAPNEWTWMGGSNTVVSGGGQPGIYGTLETPAVGNVPGSRVGATGWTDKNGKLWLFGGVAYDINANYGYLNDVWKFDPSTNELDWMGGSNSTTCAGCGIPGAYGTFGGCAGNTPGGAPTLPSWTDPAGNFWLVGGNGADANGTITYLNDLWEFNPSTNSIGRGWGGAVQLAAVAANQECTARWVYLPPETSLQAARTL